MLTTRQVLELEDLIYKDRVAWTQVGMRADPDLYARDEYLAAIEAANDTSFAITDFLKEVTA